jgi:hypothetical protein
MTKLGCEKYFLQGRILSTAGAASRFTKQTSEILFIAENSVFFCIAENTSSLHKELKLGDNIQTADE